MTKMWFFSPLLCFNFQICWKRSSSSLLTTAVLFFTGYVIFLQFSILRTLKLVKGFPCGSTGKESACNVGDPGLIPGLGRSPGEGKGYPTPVFWPGEFHGLQSMGLQRVGHDWATFTFAFTFQSWARETAKERGVPSVRWILSILKMFFSFAVFFKTFYFILEYSWLTMLS